MDNPIQPSPNGPTRPIPPTSEGTFESSKSFKALSTATLVFIIGLAAYLRLTGLGDESFWYDEGYTMAYTRLPFTKMIAYTATRDSHPPLYYILIKFWRILGDSEAWLRFPSAVFGIAAVACLWSLAKEHWGTAAATASSLLLATSQAAIYYSQENRMYSLVILLAALSLRFFLRFVSLFQNAGEDGHDSSAPRASRRDCVGVTVFTLALLYTHNVTIFLWGTQLLIGGLMGFIPFVRSRRRISGGLSAAPAFRNIAFRQWLLCQAVIGALYLPWLPVVLSQSGNVHARWWWDEQPNVDSVWRVLGFILFWGMWGIRKIPALWNPLKLITLLVGIRTIWNFRDTKSLVLGASVAMPLLMSYLYSNYRSPIMIDRTLLFVCIPLLALIGSFLSIPARRGVTEMWIGTLRTIAGVLIVAFVVFVNFTAWQVEKRFQSKEDFRAAASHALKFADGATAVVFNNSASQAAFDYYFHRYDRGRNVDEFGVPCHYYDAPAGNSAMDLLVTPESVEALDRKLVSHRRVVFVNTPMSGRYSDPSGLLQKYFESNWRYDQKISANHIYLYIFTKPGY